MATSMQDVSATAVAEASDGLQPWAGVRGGGGRKVDPFMDRSRPEDIVPCRGTYGTEGLPAMVLLAQYFGNAKRLASVATVVTQLVHGPNAFGVSYDVEALRREINRWLSLGPDQSTTLIDEILRQHREWVMGGEEGPFAKLGEVLYHLKFFRYEKRGEETHHIVDGELIAELRRICAALTSEHSHLTGTCHIEMAFLLFFNMAVGDEELRKLLVFVFAHCLFGAVGMAVALKLLKCFRKQLSAVAFDEDLLKAREALVLALDGGVEATIAAAVAAFNSAWSAVEAEAVKAYPHEACVALQYQMQKVDLVEHMEQLREVLDVLKTAKEPVMVFVAPKGIVSCFGQKPTTLKVLRCRFDPGAITTALEGLHKLNNSQALLSNAVALLVAMGNYGTSGEVDADLMDHLRGCGKGCQLDIYAHIFYGLRHSALMSSIQGDVAVFDPSGARWVVARRPGEAALVYSFEDMARDAGYESVHEFLQDARNSYDVTEMRAVVQFRDEARLFDERYEPPKDALRAKHLALMARRAARTLAGQEKGGSLSRTTVVLAGTQSYYADGQLRDSNPGAAGVFGARVSFVGWRRWSSKDELIDWLCDEGADVLDYELTTGTAELAAFLGSSESIDELKDRQYLCLIPDNWPAPRAFTKVTEVLQRFVYDDRCYRESVMDRFFASGAASFFEWRRRDDCTVFEKRYEEVDNGLGSTCRRLVRLARATGPDGALYQIGVDLALVRRSPREVPAPAPAAEPAPLDEDLDEDMEDVTTRADPPKWTQGSRFANALELIFAANPTLICDPPPNSRERWAIAKRLCKPNPSTAPDDVDLFNRAFQWGDDQWIAWHDANDVDSEEDEEEEEPADDDPFAEHNVPYAGELTRPRLLELYGLKFGGPPPKQNYEIRMFPGSYLDWVRYKIVND
uniref:Uncharacterized protein n=1 Tax=Pelagomonas calceolata TaxID=35677 RepID=A0A7S3ZUF0_9STRA